MPVSEIYKQILQLNPYEVAGFVTGAAGVWLAARQNIYTWPVSLAGVLLSIIVFYNARLYADVVLQFFYVGVTGYGWYQWLFGGKNKTELPVSNAPARLIFGVMAAGIVLSPVVGYLFSTYTDAAAPYLDSSLAVFSVLATLLLGRKLIENWLMWIVIDLLYTGLFFAKELYLYSVLYFVFTLLAIHGFKSWRKEMRLVVG